MALGTGYAQQRCNLARALEVVGERWTMLVLRDCFYGVRRFGDLLTHLDISRAVLTERLGTLVEAGVLERKIEGGHPLYRLTDAGLALWPILFGLLRWGGPVRARRRGRGPHLRPRHLRHRTRRDRSMSALRIASAAA